jgi:Lrp/AsnC family transcriptional regulator
MDEIDRKLLALLQEDASLSLAQLAERVGLSSTPCWKRVQKLEAAGVLVRRVALVAPEKVGIGLVVFVAIEAADHSPEWLDRFARTVTALPEVMDVYRMAGEIDYMLRVAVADMADFDVFYKRLIAAVPLRNVTSRFAMERIKHSTAYPLHRSAFRERGYPGERPGESTGEAEAEE